MQNEGERSEPTASLDLDFLTFNLEEIVVIGYPDPGSIVFSRCMRKI